MTGARAPRRRRASDPADGRIVLSESRGIRYLHFGSEWVQGAMAVRDPAEPVLEYVRRMCAWLLFLEPPARIAQLGLGAGALTRWALARLPAARVAVVDSSRDVIAAARSHFALPLRDPRLEVVRADAGRWIAAAAARGRFGVLQVDLYDARARGPAIDTSAFYRACRRSIAEPGIAVFNLFGEHASFAPNRARIAAAFDGRALELPPTDAGNAIVLAFAGPPLDVPVARLLARGRALRRARGLEFDEWARQLADRYADGGRLRL